MNVKPVALPVFISLTGKPCLLPLELKINIEWMIFTEYNPHGQNGNWNINSRIIQWRWQRFTCIQESIREGCLESDVAHRQRSPHRVVEGVPGVVRVQLVLGGFEERQYVLPAPTSILFEFRTIFWRCQPFITKSWCWDNIKLPTSELATSSQSWGWQFWVYPLLRIANPSYNGLSSLTGDI